MWRQKTICNEKGRKTMIQTVRISSQDLGREFGIEKSSKLIIKSGKSKTTKRIELPNLERIRTLGEEKKVKDVDVLEVETIKQAGIKEN